MPTGRSVSIPKNYEWVAIAGRLIKHKICSLNELNKLSIQDFFNGLMICDWLDYCEYIANIKES